RPTLVPDSSNTESCCQGGRSTRALSADVRTAPYSGTGTFSRPAGTYSYTVTDSKSCTATTTGDITQPTTLVPDSSNTEIFCHGDIGTVTGRATGGTSPDSGTGTGSVSAGNHLSPVTAANSRTATTT